MITSRRTLLLLSTGIVLCIGRSFATDWPHWRGPFLNGSTDEKNLPAAWGKTENIKWVASMPGLSSATAVIAGGRVFLSSTDREGDDLLALCLDARSGKELWRRKLGTSSREVPRNNPATPSPVTDGKSVFFMYGSGDLAALDYEGNILWSRNIEAEYGNISIKYGYSSSPLLYDGRLYVLIQRRHTAYRPPKSTTLDAFMLAIDPKTGKNIWKQPRETDALNESLDSYSSPIVHEYAGRAEILVIGADYITANDPVTGRQFWRYGYSQQKGTRDRNISSPVAGEGLVFGVPPRGRKGLLALKSGGEQTLADARIAWRFEGPGPDCSTPLYYRGNIYILADRKGGVLTCLDARTGRQKWQGELGGGAPWWASITAGDGKLYCVSEAAEAVVLLAGDDRFEVLCRIDMEDKPVKASVAIADGHLFIRTASKLVCVGG
ncbi:MAG: PQQ-binding-like beta-propeller repeat protein [Phycisphaerales bacterium]|nr:MAG: PQQ-binding-like beta-propeller repeat protein [Phycisphaerales bacterium]